MLKPTSKHLLVTANDVKRVRTEIIEEQNGIDPITKRELVSPCLDHSHEIDQQVRAVLSREINVMLGKIENSYKRNISYWCDVPLSVILREMADYIDKPSKSYIHPGWLKKCEAAFNKLNSKAKDKVLASFNIYIIKPNDTKRKKEFKKFIRSKLVSYGEIIEEMRNEKEASSR